MCVNPLPSHISQFVTYFFSLTILVNVIVSFCHSPICLTLKLVESTQAHFHNVTFICGTNLTLDQDVFCISILFNCSTTFDLLMHFLYFCLSYSDVKV